MVDTMSRNSATRYWYDNEDTLSSLRTFKITRIPIDRLKAEELVGQERAYATVRKFDKAIPFHLEVLNRAKKNNDPISAGYAHENLAYAYLMTNNFEDSKNHYIQALEINKKYFDELVHERIHINLGKLHQQLQEYDSAIDCFLKVLNSQTNHDFRYKDVTKRLGECYEQNGMYNKALECYGKYYTLIDENSCSTSELVYTMTIIARLHETLNNKKDAFKWYEEIITCYKQNNDGDISKMVNNAMLKSGDIKFQEKDYDSAYRHYAEARSHAKQFRLSTKQLKLKLFQIYCEQGIAFQYAGSYSKAYGKYTQALKIVQSLPNHQIKKNLEREVKVDLGNLRLLTDDLEGAKHWYQQIGILDYKNFLQKQVETATSLQNKEEEIFSTYLLGIFCQLLKNPEEAYELFKMINEGDADKIRDRRSSLYYRLGTVSAILNQPTDVVKYFQYFEKTANHTTNSKDLIQAYESMGDAYQNLGDNDDNVIEAYTAALKLSRDDCKVESVHLKLAKVYQRMPQREQDAIRHFEIVSKTTKLTDIKRDVFNALGLCFDNIKSYKTAIKWYEKALEITQEVDNKPPLYDKMIELYLKSNVCAYALECCERSLEILKQCEHTNKEKIGHTYESKAYILRQQRDYPQADFYYRAARKIAKDVKDNKRYVHLTLELGEMCRRQGQFDEAKNCYRDANSAACQSHLRGKELLQTHANIGKLYLESKDYPNARVKFTYQLNKARQLEDVYMEVDALLSLASLSFAQDKEKGAKKGIDYLKQINLTDIKDTEIRTRLGEAYKRLADSYRPHNQQRNQKALDRAKENFEEAHTIWEGQTVARSNTAYESNFKNEQELTRIYAKEGDANRALHHRLNSWERSNCSNSDVPGIIQLLKEAQYGCIIYSFNEGNLIMWSFQGNDEKPTFFSTQDASVSQVQGLIEACCKNSQNEQHSVEKSPLKKLYKILIAPIEDTLTKEELVIDADGPLHNVPFAALQDSSGKYLFEYKRVRIAPSLALLKLIMERSKDYTSVTGVLVIAATKVASVYHEGELKSVEPLLSADEEVKSIAELFGVEPLTGKLASKQNFLKVIKEMPAIIHIVAHGSKGKIYLASTQTADCEGTPSENDHLTMDDVRAFEVIAQLVVLSCCSSGKGDVTNAGEVLAMSRAFIAAGARAVIATLWNISDECSTVLMVKFYQGLKDGQSIGSSLQKAMGHVQRQRCWSHPIYWAPFVHIGDDFIIDPSTFPAEKKPSMDVNASPKRWNRSTKVRY